MSLRMKRDAGTAGVPDKVKSGVLLSRVSILTGKNVAYNIAYVGHKWVAEHLHSGCRRCHKSSEDGKMLAKEDS